MKATINGLRIAVVALGCYWLLLFIGTHISPNRLLSRLMVNDKLMHGFAFFGLAFLIAWAVPTSMARLYRNVIVAAIIAVVYAALDELLQIPVGRTADWLDLVADCVGICAGLGFYCLVRAAILRSGLTIFQDPAESK